MGVGLQGRLVLPSNEAVFCILLSKDRGGVGVWQETGVSMYIARWCFLFVFCFINDRGLGVGRSLVLLCNEAVLYIVCLILCFTGRGCGSL